MQKRHAKKPARHAAAELCPKADKPLTGPEKQLFVAYMSLGMESSKAARQIRPHLSLDSAYQMGSNWSKALASEIAAMKATAANASRVCHGVTTAWVMGEMKEMYLTTLSAITPESRFCKKHKKTTTHTDAGPKEVEEIEKPCPLATLKAMAELGGLNLKPAATAEEEADPLGLPDLKTMTAEDFMRQLVGPGSPIARRLAGQQAT